MVQSCAASNCKIKANKGSGISFHKFPLDNPELLKRWILLVNRKDLIPTKHLRLCSRHFTPDSFWANYKTSRQLKPDAVPTLFDIKEGNKLKTLRRKVVCCIPSCTSGKRTEEANGQFLSFHEFPSDCIRRSKWEEAIFRHTLVPVVNEKVSYVCSLHFTENDYVEHEKRRILKDTAVPSVFSAVPSAFSSVPSVISAVPSVISAVPSMFSTVPSVFSAVPSVFSAAPSVLSAVPSVISAVPSVISAAPSVFSTVPSVFSVVSGVSSSGYQVSNSEQLTPSVNIKTKYCNPEVVLKRSTLSEVLEDNLYCRLCAKVDEDCIPIFDAEGKKIELKKKIHKYLPVNVSESDNLPNKICPSCVAAINAWHEYAESCLTAEIKLLEIFPELKVTEVKAENCEVVMPDNMSTENQELSHNQDISNITINSDGHNVVEDVEVSGNNNEDDASNIVNEYNDEFTNVQSYQHERNTHSSVAHKPNLCLLIFNNSHNLENRIKTDKPQNAEIHMPQNIETVEPNSETNKAKVRIYDPNKPHKPTSYKLREHKIYQNKCDKTFIKRKDKECHERAKHTGENIFICDVCGKGFLSKIILEKHTRIHSTSLNFMCQYCNGKFNTRYSRNNHQRHCPYKTDTISLDG